MGFGSGSPSGSNAKRINQNQRHKSVHVATAAPSPGDVQPNPSSSITKGTEALRGHSRGTPQREPQNGTCAPHGCPGAQPHSCAHRRAGRSAFLSAVGQKNPSPFLGAPGRLCAPRSSALHPGAALSAPAAAPPAPIGCGRGSRRSNSPPRPTRGSATRLRGASGERAQPRHNAQLGWDGGTGTV